MSDRKCRVGADTNVRGGRVDALLVRGVLSCIGLVGHQNRTQYRCGNGTRVCVDRVSLSDLAQH